MIYISISKSFPRQKLPNRRERVCLLDKRGWYNNRQFTSKYYRKKFNQWKDWNHILFSSFKESYWRPIYEIVVDIMKTDESLNRTEPPTFNEDPNELFINFDLYLANARHNFNRVTLIITLIHSIWCHSNTNHFNHFVS